MNVLFPYLARWRSANWSRYHQLLSALCRQGHRVHVLEAPPRPGSGETNYTDVAVPLPAGMTVHEVPVPLWNVSFPLEKLVKKGLVTLATRRFVGEMVQRHQIDVLLLYNFPQLVLASVVRGRCRVVFDVADDLLAMFAVEAGRFAPLLTPFARWFFNRLALTSDLVTTPSLTLAPLLPGRVRVIPNGVDVAAVQRADGRDIRSQLAGPVVGFVGALEYFVDLDLILEAASRLPQSTFLVVGGGRRLAWLQEEVARRALPNVVVTGPVPYPKNLGYVGAMDVCLIPFAPGPIGDYAAPLKLFEYAALGKPIVATPLQEVRAIAGDLVNVAQGAQETVATITQILADPAAYSERTRAAQDLVCTRYDWERIAADLPGLIAAGY